MKFFVSCLILLLIGCGDTTDSHQALEGDMGMDVSSNPDIGLDANTEPGELVVDFQHLRMAVGGVIVPEIRYDGRVALAGTLTLSSSDSAAVTVDQDVVTAVKIGNAVLTIRHESGAATSAEIEVIQGRFKQIEVGEKSSCALDSDGHAWCWGYAGESGEMKSMGDQVFTELAVADRAACGLTGNGDVYCWGTNLVPFTSEYSVVPLLSPLTEPALEITAGTSHVCVVLRGGTVACRGDNSLAQLGVSGYRTSWITTTQSLHSLQASQYSTCGLNPDAEPVCWGLNWGRKISNEDRYYVGPTKMDRVVREIHPGLRNSCAVDHDNNLVCWGWNVSGVFGPVDDRERSNGSVVMTDVRTASFKGETVCSLLNSGRLACVGYNSTGTIPILDAPAIVPYPRSPAGYWSSVKMGVVHGCGIDIAGDVYCWGTDLGGVVSAAPFRSYEPKLMPIGPVDALTLGGSHACWTSSAGVQCLGMNDVGQLGNGTFFSSLSPVSPGVFQTVDAGSSSTCAIADGGNVWCWGENRRGQCGKIPSLYGVNRESSPRRVSLASSALDISTGHQHACALLDDGSIQCWGDNAYGQLGVNPTGNALLPQSVNILEDGENAVFVQVDAGSFHTCGLSTNQNVYCWGDRRFSQSNRVRSIPYSLPPVREITVGGIHNCALTIDNELYCWGGILDQTSVPWLAASNVKSATGMSFSECWTALTGEVYCLGAGGGLWATGTQNTPLEIPGITNPDWLESVLGTICGQEDGQVKCWGGGLPGYMRESDWIFREPHPSHSPQARLLPMGSTLLTNAPWLSPARLALNPVVHTQHIRSPPDAPLGDPCGAREAHVASSRWPGASLPLKPLSPA